MKKVFPPVLALLLGLGLCACTARSAPVPGPTASPTAVPTATAAPTAAPTATPVPTPTATPSPEPTPAGPAEELTGELEMRESAGRYTGALRDDTMESWITFDAPGQVYISCQREIYALYLGWFRSPGAYTLTAGDREVQCGEEGFLFEYILLPEPVREIAVNVPSGKSLGEIRAFGAGTPPADVQVWEPPCAPGEADVLTFPTHADDDVIFLGALMAHCVDRGLTVQVCYMCSHDGDWYTNTHTRSHELLRGLWEMGIRHYPVMGRFLDYAVMSLDDAKAKFPETEVIGWQVEMLRRFRPLVAVGQDRQGEYGHGAHMLNAQCLEQAAPLAADGTQYPDSAEKWGTWDTPKLYLHSAEENQITIDAETPLAAFGGRTAFEVVNDAMLCHQSQLIYEHRPQLESSGYPRFDCRKFGLVRSTVGADTGDDIMEHTEGIRDLTSGEDGDTL